MDHAFWLNRWQKTETGFHRQQPHPMLQRWWPTLKLPKSSGVFVPLCGKSIDLEWLRDQGHRVVGSELSPLAVDQFFAMLGATPVIEAKGQLRRFEIENLVIWQGDVFALKPEDVLPIDAIYDRAALVALPPDMQQHYVTHMARIAPPGSRYVLISLDYREDEMNGPPFATPEALIDKLFSPYFVLDHDLHNTGALDESQNLKERGLTSLTESLYILTRRS